MGEEKKNRIFDPIYGYVELDEVEFKLVNSPLFQRLHWIKQLGPLNTIFPSAQHSRFSHSIGVFHIMTKMINKLREKSTDDQKKCLRLAALLHDIGHVPLSHIGEQVLAESYQPKIRSQDVGKKPARWKDLFNEEYYSDSTKLHELLSIEILLNSKEIDNILQKYWPGPRERKEKIKEIAKIITGKHEDTALRMMLHSELDADRLDFLLRDSFFTGVEYGKIDLDYIISRFIVQKDKTKEDRLCIEEKGLHTIEHYIMGRFFLRTQVIYNRKVSFMDLLYKEVMSFLVNKEKMQNYADVCPLMSLEDVLQHIRHTTESVRDRDHLHRIYEYTDALVFDRMRKLHEALDKKEKAESATDEEQYINDCIKTIMDGNISDPVFEDQMLFSFRTLEERRKVSSKIKDEARELAQQVASQMGIYVGRIQRVVKEEDITKYFATSEPAEEEEKGASNEEAVRLYLKNTEWVEFAANAPASILRPLANKRLVIFRVYYINPKREEENETERKKKEIEAAFEGFRKKIESFQYDT